MRLSALGAAASSASCCTRTLARYRDFLRAGPGILTLVRATREILSAGLTRPLHRIQAETLVICGENDTLIAPEAGHYSPFS